MNHGNAKIKIGLIQASSTQDMHRNLEKEIKAIKKAASLEANIICTRELFLNPYFCQTRDSKNFDLATQIPGEISEQLGKLAQELSIVLIVSLFENSLPGMYHNTALVFDVDGKIAGKYRKTHIPDDPEYFEKYYFTPGQDLNCVFKTAFGNIGVLICWDQWFCEPARSAALQGADILFYPTAIGWHNHEKDELGKTQKEAWQIVQRGHAISNGLPICSINRVGREGRLEFWGGSFVCDSFGQMIAVAGEMEEILIAGLDFKKTETQRRDWPFFRDRRIDLYNRLIEPYK